MGEVFRATDQQLGRQVAVKLLLPSGHEVRAAERFQREARAAARLSDPHVVSVYDFGRHGDGFFLVMELVEGGTVAGELAQHGPLPLDRAIDVIEQAAAGLAAAHLAGVLHRDVKPANLLLAPGGTVKVADFGIAHLPGEGTTTLTAAGQIIGSTHYLAPERAKGAQAGKPADVYALGCVLYELVTGRPPFKGEHPTAILYQHVDAAPEPPSLVRPELSGPFEDVLLRMLAKNAADRPTAADIAAGALRAQPATVPTLVAGPLAAPSNRKTLWAAVIAALAVAAAVLTGAILDGNEPRVPPTTDVGPRPGDTSSTPVSPPATTSTSSTTGSTEASTAPTTATQPSQSASQPVTPPTSSPATATTGTTAPGTSEPSTPSQTSTTPSDPTQGTPSETPPTSTPPSETPTTSTPGTATPSPQVNGTPSAVD